MDYRIITPPMDFTDYDEPSAGDEQPFQTKLGTNFQSEAGVLHDSAKQEKSTRDKYDNSSRKKRRRRKSNSVRETSFCEESVPVKNEKTTQLHAEGGILNGDAEADGSNSEMMNTGVAGDVSEREGSLSQVLLSY